MKQSVILFAVALAFAACSQDESQDPNIIQLSAAISGGDGVKAGTRAYSETPADYQNTQFISGAAIHVEAYKTGGAKYTEGNYSTTDGNGTLSGTLYYPADGSNIDICAYYPSSINSGSTTFEVNTDQTTIANYRSSDLMYVKKSEATNKAKNTTHNLTFYHAMSQIIVNIEPNTSAGVTAEDITTNVSAVTIKNTVKTASLTITNGDIAATKNGTTTNDIEILGNKATNIGLIVPQTVGAGEFIAITYAGTTYTYSLTEAKTFAEGTKYIYTFTMGAAGIELKSLTITNWSADPNRDQETGNSGKEDFII